MSASKVATQCDFYVAHSMNRVFSKPKKAFNSITAWLVDVKMLKKLAIWTSWALSTSMMGLGFCFIHIHMPEHYTEEPLGEGTNGEKLPKSCIIIIVDKERNCVSLICLHLDNTCVGFRACSPMSVFAVAPLFECPLCSCVLQLITVYTVPGMDSDWLIGERGNQKGKVPVTYLELLS